MAELPTEELRWASETVLETVAINGVQTLVENKVEPTDAFKNTGILARQRVSRPKINWFFDTVSRYINHLVERLIVGSVYTSIVNEDETELSTRLGGTWTLIGNNVVNSVTIYYFKKDA